ncbi:MAG: XRE family transcriptional regulator [Micrococcales bacterium]|nr:XRE family transcriptional regulator [Micrococcales bacterium]
MDAVGAEVLRAARVRAGLSQVELGRRAGVPQSVVSSYERGRREPTVSALRHLVAAAGFELNINLTPTSPTQSPPFVGPVGRRVQRRRAQARELLELRGYRNAAVFGSVVRGTDTAESDVDLLVDLPTDAGLTQLTRATIDLEALLGVPVDLVPRHGLRERVAREIQNELVPL